MGRSACSMIGAKNQIAWHRRSMGHRAKLTQADGQFEPVRLRLNGLGGIGVTVSDHSRQPPTRMLRLVRTCLGTREL